MKWKPIIAVNMKVYKNVLSKNGALEIVRAAEKVAKEYDVDLIVAPPITLLAVIAGESGVPVYSQHGDPLDPGAHTGWVPLEAVKECGAEGVILNHSEHQMKINDIAACIAKSKIIGLKTLVCAPTPEVGAAIAALSPDIVAVEPPELIGTGIAVSKAKPEVVTNSVRAIRRINENITILVGAGITTGDDVAASIRLGAQGVLVASAVVKAKDHYKILKEYAEKALKALEEVG